MMLLSKPLLQECIPNGPRKWNVYDLAAVHMPNLRVPEAELARSEPMGMDRYSGQ